MQWHNSEDIGLALYDAHPEIDPLTVRFTDLHRMVLELPDFDGDPKGSSEVILEAIQMAWLEEYNED